MSKAAKRYAKAILETAQGAGTAAQVAEDMALITETVNGHKELQNFISSPEVKADKKEVALKEIFASTQPLTQGLFHLLHENQRFDILPAIAAQYKAQYDVANGIEVATVTTAVPIDAELEAKVLAKVKEFSDKKITLKNIVDPAIIGGFILRVGDKQYNASVANRLLALKRELSN
ncbi:ATP synthase subunit delta [Flavobacterium akiainvivens]|uniref:ATP synthase subunit delta n=1 Tax=Flavobacterium akiainvivens TaxID=1202724 RepID=A0A0M8MJJ6_9FLAO|nr:ATP synthase F1 subunit delta [Flavobacterium akiainvivens]KOS07117.1 ATP synthase subunit delta [Flavobacterium akiainvivens]SFQ75793.1 ATP synthase F1 subcomplex delta subunit [Flavobacterium akiainvivens]